MTLAMSDGSSVVSDSLTFFAPLKEENSLSRSNVFQTVLGLFRKETPKHDLDNDRQQQSPQKLSLSSQQPSSSLTNRVHQKYLKQTQSADDRQPYEEADLNATIRPITLDVASLYKPRDLLHGSEVEMRLKNFSTMFRDIPKMISGTNENLKELAPSVLSSASSDENMRQYWMADEHCHECYECGDPFTTFRRRHHCRSCGHIFCKRCCHRVVPGHMIGLSNRGMQRTCTYCYNNLLSKQDLANGKSIGPQLLLTEYDGPNDTFQDTTILAGGYDQLNTSLRAQAKSSRSRSVVSTHGSPTEETSHHPLGMVSPLPFEAPSWASPYTMFDVTPGGIPDENDFVSEDGVTIPLHELWSKMADDKDGLEFRDRRFRLRKFTNSVTGTELVDWLIANDVASTRLEACAVGQALLEAKWIKCVVDDTIFQDAYRLYQRGQSSMTVTDRVQYASLLGNSDVVQVKTSRDRRVSKEAMFGADNEPKWVRDISNESQDELPYNLDVFWNLAQPTARPLLSPGGTPLSDDGSTTSSTISNQSVSSYVEIDNSQKIIRYKRPRERLDADGTQQMTSGLLFPTFLDHGLTEISADYLRSYLAWHGTYLNNPCVTSSVGWRSATLTSTQVNNKEKQVFLRLQKIYFRHSMLFLHQLLEADDLDTTWADIIVPLARKVCDAVTPNAEVNMNICHYVHIKKLLDGGPSECRLVNGVVFSKNVVHARMKSRIDNPLILLVATPLEYQRIHYKLSSLDPIVQQETEFFRNLVLRILRRNPDVVISQCSVSHKARNRLREAGISLVINVKPSVMERLARCTGADVAKSIDQLQTVKLGTCSRFRVCRHYNGVRPVKCSDGVKSPRQSSSTKSYKCLMYLDGCNISQGCTVIIRDSPAYEKDPRADEECRKRLARIKEVMLFLLKVMYHSKLEISYLMDQQDIASNFPLLVKKEKSKQAVNSFESLFPRLHDSTEVLSDDTTTCSLSVRGVSVSSVTSEPRTLTPDHSDVESTCQDEQRSLLATPVKGTQNQGYFCGTEPSKRSKLFVESLDSMLLSISPFISPTLPFLLTLQGETSPLRHYLPPTVFWSDMFYNHPELTGHNLSKCIRYRTESTDKLDDDAEIDMNSFRSRSGTSESFALPQNMWRTPQHQKQIEAEFASASAADDNIYDDLVLNVDLRATKNLNQDYYEPSVKSRSQILRESNDVNVMTSASEYLRVASQLSSRSNVSKDELTSWEKSIMHEVLGGRAPLSPKRRRVLPVTSSPVKEREKENFLPNGTATSASNKHCGRDRVVWKPQKHKFVSMSISKPLSSTEMRDLLADFRATGSALQNITSVQTPWKCDSPGKQTKEPPAKESSPVKRKSCSDAQNVILRVGSDEKLPPMDCLDPRNHQHIYVLFSSYSARSPNAPYPCVIPWAVDIDYYHGNDITLGGFLERYCFRPSYHCPSPTCKRPMVEHVRSFVHGTTCMNIILKELAKPVNVPAILSWCWDPHTQTPTDIKPLSTDAWSMSFAKFLELRLQSLSSSSHHRRRRNPSDGDDRIIPPFQSFQYFLLRDIVASFKCFEIVVFEIALPPPTLTFETHTDWRKPIKDVNDDADVCSVTSQYWQFVDEMNVLSKIGYEVVDSIHDMIDRSRMNNPFDQLIGSDQSEAPVDLSAIRTARESYFEDLLVVYQEDKLRLRENVDTLHLKIQSLRTSRFQSASDESDLSKESMEPDLDLDLPRNLKECNCSPNDVEMSLSSRKQVLQGLLELTCLICNLVQDWNSRIASVTDQDRASRRGSKTSTLYFVSQSRKSLASRSSREGEPSLKKVGSLHTVHESIEEVENDVTENDSAPIKSKVMSDETKEENGAVEIQSNETAKDRFLTVDGIGKDKNESKHYGVKRLSRTASSMGMYIVGHLLSSTNQIQLTSPFPASDHYLLPNCVGSQIVVRDSEPSSIIAYTLRTPEYKHFLLTEDVDSSSSIDEQASALHVEPDHVVSTPGEKLPESGDVSDPVRVEFKGTAHLKQDVLHSPKQHSPRPSSPNPGVTPHTEVQFGDSTTKFYCKVYFTSGFKKLRSQILSCPEEDYVSSLSRCIRWVARGGKSGSAFHKTLDDRLVLKQMSRFDLHSFLELAPSYFEYVSGSIENKSPTALSKILGVYRVSFSNTSTNQSFKQDILVMENLFYKRDILQVFDLKGSVRNRHVKTDSSSAYTSYSTSPKVLSSSSLASDSSTTTNRNNQVLLDENLLTIMRDNPLYVHAHTKMLIRKALTDDAYFLANHGIIDYSLLVGIDDERKEIVVGIIDYMRTFTWDKKLEHLVKSSINMGKRGTRSMPTVVSPEMYRSRFCEAMDRYFQVVPDRWFEMQAYQEKSCC